jgi:hypothetical protein
VELAAQAKDLVAVARCARSRVPGLGTRRGRTGQPVYFQGLFALDRVKVRLVTELPIQADRGGFPRGGLRG